MNWYRLLQVYTAIVLVSMVSVLVFAQLLSDVRPSLVATAVGGVALVSAVLGGTVAGSIYLYYVFQTVWKRVLGLAWPVMVEQVTRTLMRTTDVLLVAQFSPAAVVAVGLSGLYAQFPLRVGQGLGGAAVALSSQETGRDDTTIRDEAITQALGLGIVLGIPMAVVGVTFGEELIALLGAESRVVELGGVYLAVVLATAPARLAANIGAKSLQGIGDTETPMYINVGANVLNIGGSIVLGLGLFGAPELRIVGVGLATATANVFSAGLFLVAIGGPRGVAELVRPHSPVITRQLVVIGIPRMAEGLAKTLARFPFNALLLLFGTEVNAGYQIGKRVYQQVTAPISRAYRVTASIMTGQELGAGDPEAARFDGWAVTALGALSVGTIGVVLVVAAEPLAELFTDDAATVTQSVGFIRAYGAAAVPMVVFITLSGSLQGAGETRLPFVAQATGVLGFLIGFFYLTGVVFEYGPLGGYVGIALSYVWMALVVLWTFVGRDWAERATVMMEERATTGDSS